MDLMERTRFAMEHYMTTHPDTVTPLGRRGHFDLPIVPKPKYLAGCQWSDGDLTARALDAWMFARQITGDEITGAETEKEQIRYFDNLIDGETGLVFVPMHSRPNREGLYTHMWDQCRAIRHLANQLTLGYRCDPDTVRDRLVKLLESCFRLSRTAVLPSGETARYWETDTYVDSRPIDKSADYGETNFVDFANVSALLITPAAQLYAVTQDKKHLASAVELANGFLAGLEKRRESTRPMIAEDGALYGHFHTCVCGLTGLSDLAKALYRAGEPARAKELLKTAERAYRWTMSENNLNRGSSCGWFPESTAHSVCDASELCCTADMIELAASLTEAGELIPGFETLQSLCEDAERFTKNELYGMQILAPEALKQFIDPRCEEDFEREKPLFWGGWAASRSWLCDYLRHYDGVPDLTTIGCCLYSGQRGFYACQKAMVKEEAESVLFRFAGSYESPLVRTKETENGMRFTLSRNCRVRIRVPGYVAEGSAEIRLEGKPVETVLSRGILSFSAEAGRRYLLTWQFRDWSVREVIGKVNDGSVRDAETGKRICFTLFYRGWRLTEVTPKEGAFIPFEKGL